jgi:hypothetical protein
METMLEPLVSRDGRGEAETGRAGQRRRRLLAERSSELRRALEARAGRRVRARDQPDHQTGDDGIDAGLEQRDPQPRAEDGGHRKARADRQVAEGRKRGEEGDREREGDDVDMSRVDGGDHDERHHVVEDDRAEQAHARARRVGGQEREHAQREGRVGRHRDRPAGRAGAAGVDG